MSKNSNYSVIPKNSNYSKKVSVRMSEICFGWYNDASSVRQMRLSEFIRDIPSIIERLESLLDEKDDRILELEQELNQTRK